VQVGLTVFKIHMRNFKFNFQFVTKCRSCLFSVVFLLKKKILLLLDDTIIIKVFHRITGFITHDPLNNNFKTHCKYHSKHYSFSLSNKGTYLSISLHSHRKTIVFYSRIMAITRSDELRHSPAAQS
jgi:hypothetical protein